MNKLIINFKVLFQEKLVFEKKNSILLIILNTYRLNAFFVLFIKFFVFIFTAALFFHVELFGIFLPGNNGFQKGSGQIITFIVRLIN